MMPVIRLTEKLPGMSSILAMRPDIYEAMCELSHLLLVGPNQGKTPEPAASSLGQLTLTQGERELIGAYVSFLNQCTFCTRSHLSITAALLSTSWEEVTAIFEGKATYSPKMDALLRIAKKIQERVERLPGDLVQAAVDAGATESDVYDTVLIAAGFAMFNRMVEGLGTQVPPIGNIYYEGMVKRISKYGYRRDSYQVV